MEAMFENFHIWMTDDLENDPIFMVACKDREIIDEERWVLASLSKEEVKQVYEYLQKIFSLKNIHLTTAICYQV